METTPTPPGVHPQLKLTLARQRRFYGPGVHTLLGLIDETGSMRAACQQMGLSYSKGRKIVQAIEVQLGFAAIETTRGGAAHGRTCLTAQGRALHAAYAAFCEEAEALVRQSFAQHFAGFNNNAVGQIP